jgi:hypothetical protein
MIRICLMLATVVVLAGCSAGDQFPTEKVSGKITYKNQPVTTGTVVFVPNGDMPSATGEIKPDGTYELTTYEENDGAVIGTHQIMVTAVEDMANKLPEERSGTPRSLVPQKYSNYSTSGLTAEVKEGEPNTVNLELK